MSEIKKTTRFFLKIGYSDLWVKEVIYSKGAPKFTKTKDTAERCAFNQEHVRQIKQATGTLFIVFTESDQVVDDSCFQ